VISNSSVGHERRLVARPLAVKRTVRSRSSGSTSPVTTEEGSASLGARGSLGVDLDLGTSWPGSVRGGGTVCGGAIGRTARGCFGRMNTTGAADRRFRRRGGTGSPGQSETSASVEPSARASRPAGRPHVVVASDGARVRGGRGVSHRVARVRGPVERRSWRRRRPATHRFFEAPRPITLRA